MGPVGFTIYINDLDDPIQNLVTLIKKFADDTKTAKIILDDQCILDMQESLNELHKWAERWGMVFNVDKCKVSILVKITRVPQSKFMANWSRASLVIIRHTNRDYYLIYNIYRYIKPLRITNRSLNAFQRSKV